MYRLPILFVLSIVLSFHCAPLSADGLALTSIERHGTTHQSACTDSNREEWKKPVFEVGAMEPHEAIKAFSILLCATPSAANRKFVATLLMPKVMWTDGSVDNAQPSRLLNKSAFTTEQLFTRGVAFNVGIADAPNELRASYLTSEACIASKTLRYVGGRWRLAAMSEGCE